MTFRSFRSTKEVVHCWAGDKLLEFVQTLGSLKFDLSSARWDSVCFEVLTTCTEASAGEQTVGCPQAADEMRLQRFGKKLCCVLHSCQ